MENYPDTVVLSPAERRDIEKQKHMNTDKLATFIVREKHREALVSLSEVIDRLPFIRPSMWCFRDIKVHGGGAFGLSAQEFERLTLQRPQGYCVEDCEMRAFLISDVQIVDGEIDALAADGSRLLTIECDDATEWELRSAIPQIARELGQRGFEKQEE